MQSGFDNSGRKYENERVIRRNRQCHCRRTQCNRRTRQMLV